MKRSSIDIADEVFRRVELLDKQDEKRKNRIYTALSFGICLAFMIGLSMSVPLLISDETLQLTAGYQTATLFASGAVGGYVLVGVMAFVFGAAAMLFCVKKFGKK